MAEQTFRSPGFFEAEIDLSSRQVQPSGTPAGVIGTAERGPAFVPITVGSFADFETRFGTLHTERFGPYAVNELLKHKTSLTYVRILGAGANDTLADMSSTATAGTVKNAGFVISGTLDTCTTLERANTAPGYVQFLAAIHDAPAAQAAAYPVLTDSPSIANPDSANLIRAMLFTASGSLFQVLDSTSVAVGDIANSAKVGAIPNTHLRESKYFKMALTSSAGPSFGSDLDQRGLRVFNVTLDPSDPNYISKVLNTDPNKFQEEQHLLYLDFAVEHEIAPVSSAAGADTVAVIHGSPSRFSGDSGLTTTAFAELFGRFDTRYTAPRTTQFISQPFGTKEWNLFHFESISDGSYANSKFKISIANLRASTNPADPYGTFEVQVRAFGDSDKSTQILERFPACSLNPNSDNYVAKKIGDYKVRYDFDQVDPDERRLVVTGKYPNVSQRIRIVMDSAVDSRDVPSNCLPFGFRGLPCIKTTDSLTDVAANKLRDRNGSFIGSSVVGSRMASNSSPAALIESIVPPVPMTFKSTMGAIASTLSGYVGRPGSNERADASFYWGVKTTRVPEESAITNAILQSNASSQINPLVESLTKFQGISKLDVLTTGSANDEFNANKFSLAKVAFFNTGTSLTGVFTQMTGSAKDHILEAAYIRDGKPNAQTYTVSDRAKSNRFTMASLLATSSIVFNRFTSYAKFTNVFYGGFDGVNILDKDMAFFRDRACSRDDGGKAQSTQPDIGLLGPHGGTNRSGTGRLNNAVASVNRAIDIITDPTATRINILSIPGMREPFITTHALNKVKDYSKAIYVMDTLQYDESNVRLYDDDLTRPDVTVTTERFDGRAIDNSYGATFFPDVLINDAVNNQVVKVPASVAAVGALAYNDRVKKPWFAPAGFNRGGLEFVQNVNVRLTSDDRDVLYDARINPIAVFPRTGFVIFGQKTLQQAKSALDRINVRRLMLEIKRAVGAVATRLLFEPNTPDTRAKFIGQVTPLLAMIQAQAGIQQFKVVMDDSNNSQKDMDANRLNGKIIVVPTRAVEFIAVDFIITNSGVVFS